MTRAEQMALVVQLTDSIKASIVTAIGAGKIPATWDGIELRQYLVDYTQENALVGRMTWARKREYKNTILVRGL